MAWREKLYERQLKRPVDKPTLEAIRSEFQRRQHEIPVASELLQNPAKQEMTIKTRWLSFIVQFNKETLRVDAELSLAAKMLATRENRQVAVQFIDSIANDLNL
jgi:cell division inhibitor SulA